MKMPVENAAVGHPPVKLELRPDFYKEGGHLFRHYSTLRTTIVMAGLTIAASLTAYTYINVTNILSLILLSSACLIIFLSFISVSAFFGLKCNQSKLYLMEMEEKKSAKSGPYTVITGILWPSKGDVFDTMSTVVVFLGIIIQLIGFCVKLYIIMPPSAGS